MKQHFSFFFSFDKFEIACFPGICTGIFLFLLAKEMELWNFANSLLFWFCIYLKDPIPESFRVGNQPCSYNHSSKAKWEQLNQSAKQKLSKNAKTSSLLSRKRWSEFPGESQLDFTFLVSQQPPNPTASLTHYASISNFSCLNLGFSTLRLLERYLSRGSKRTPSLRDVFSKCISRILFPFLFVKGDLGQLAV